MSLLVYLMIVFNNKVTIEIPYATMQECLVAQEQITKEPQRLIYTKRGINSIEYRCISEWE